MDDELTDANRAQTVAESDSFTPHRYRHFSRFIPKGGTVLDVGCSTGRGGEALARLRPDLTLDGLEALDDRGARATAPIYRTVFVGDLGELSSVARPPYDAVLLGEVIEHIPYTQLIAAIVSLREGLAPGGMLLLTTPNPHYVFLRWRGGSVLGGPHVSVHCHRCLAELLRAHGFRVLRVEGTGRMSRLIGRRFPLAFYGSYLMAAVAAPAE
jgi:SAM-dependent methyltransferase